MIESKSREEPRNESLRRVVELFDHLETALTEERGETSEAPGTVAERVLQELDRDGGPTFGTLRREMRLTDSELLIVLYLLRLRVAEGGGSASGRKVLRFFHRGTWEVLRAARHLEATSPLLANGIVECVAASPAGLGPLDYEFRLADWVVERILEEVNPRRLAEPLPAYSDNVEYLLDLRELVRLTRRRAIRRFGMDDGGDGEPATRVPVSLERAVAGVEARIRERLERTGGSAPLPAVEFRKQYRLNEDETLAVAALFFQEVLTGDAYLDATDLLKLVSTDDRDLLEKRGLIAQESPLVRHEILVADESVHPKELSGEISLAPWAFEAMLGDATSAEAIDSDARLEFHEYIQGIRDSHDFFTRLRLPPRQEGG